MIQTLTTILLKYLGRRTTKNPATPFELAICHILYLAPFAAIAATSLGYYVFDLGELSTISCGLFGLAFLYLIWAAKFRQARPDTWLVTHIIHLWRIYARIAMSSLGFALLVAVSFLIAPAFPYIIYVDMVIGLALLVVPALKICQGYWLFLKREPVRLVFRTQDSELNTGTVAPGQIHPSLRQGKGEIQP